MTPPKRADAMLTERRAEARKLRAQDRKWIMALLEARGPMTRDEMIAATSWVRRRVSDAAVSLLRLSRLVQDNSRRFHVTGR